MSEKGSKAPLPSVLIVEDQQLLRLGLKIALQRLNCCQILEEVADGETAIQSAQKLHPDIILMDVGLPGMDGIEACWRIKQMLPRSRVLMLTSHTRADKVTAALGAGADGYCVKETAIAQIAEAINAIMRGEIWLDPTIADLVVRNHHGKDSQNRVSLSETELQILSLMSKGETNLEIADQLGTSAAFVTRLMHDMIGRFVCKTNMLVETDPPRESDNSREWLTVFLEGIEEGTIFAEKYLLQDLLGTGGIGAVFKAKHLYMDRFVAIKMLRPAYTRDRLAMRNFQREATAIANVQHQNVVAVHDFGVSPGGEPFLVMEYVQGNNLADILTTQHSVPTKRLLQLCVQVCAGVAAAHARGIVHCDLKPSNILVQGNGSEEVAKVVDFGLAQIISPNQTPMSTKSAVVCGTPYYMSPEQCTGKPMDLRTDIYSLGCIMYEALTGRNPFAGATTSDTFANHRDMVAPPLSSASEGRKFPEKLESSISSMLAKEPQQRPQSMDAVMQLLTSIDCRNEEEMIVQRAVPVSGDR